MTRRCLSFSLALTCLYFVITPVSGQTDWNRFRGGNGQGVASGDSLTPATLDVDANLLWKVNLHDGNSSPCVWNDRIFITGFADEKLTTYGINRTNGEIVWSKSEPIERLERSHEINGPASPTPTTDGKHVFVYCGSIGLICYDMNGDEKWRRSIPETRNLFGTAASPVVIRDKLILCSDRDSGSYLEAIDPASGETIWRTERPQFKSAWSTPVLREGDDGDELIVYGIWWLTGYRLDDGEELWSVPGLADEPCITPITSNGLVYVTSYNMKTNPEVIGLPTFEKLLETYDTDENSQLSLDEVRENQSILSRFDADGEGDHPLRGFFRYLDEDRDGQLTSIEWKKMIAFLNSFEQANGLVAIKPGRAGERESEILWQHSTGVPECPSPLCFEDRIYLIKNGGILTCLDASTGEVNYQQRIGAGGPYYASPVVCGDRIYLASARGTVTVIAAGQELEILATNDLGERIMATPALVDGNVYVRTDKALYAFGSNENTN